MKNTGWLFLIVIILVSLIFNGCSQATPSPKTTIASTQTPTAAPSPVPSSTSISQAKTTEIKISYPSTTTSITHTTVWLPFKEALEKRSSGSLKVTLYPAAALGKVQDQYDLAVRGVADISWGSYGMMPGRFPLLSALTLPIGIKSSVAGMKLVQQLKKSYPTEFDKMHSDVKSLYILSEQGQPIHLTKPAYKLEDLRGRKIAGNATSIACLKPLEVSSITMDATDYYLSLEKKVIEGIVQQLIGARDFHIDEVTSFTFDVALAPALFFVVMNLNTWNNLTPEQQKIVVEENDRLWTVYNSSMDNSIVDIRNTWKAKKHDFYTPPPEEYARWEKAFQPLFDKYVSDCEAKGLPGKDFLGMAVDYLKKEQTQTK